MEWQIAFVVFLIVLALIFDFLNGFHDSANAIASIVSTRTLKPHWAVLWAAFFNFIAFLFFKTTVANTMGTGLIDPTIVDSIVIFATLCGAIFWNVLTWYFGLPSSSSHALIGGLVGSAVIKSGVGVLKIAGLLKVLFAIILAPLLGFILGLILMRVLTFVFARVGRHRVQNFFKRLQFVTSAMISLGHGGNDAQKTMGIIAILLFSNQMLQGEFYVPLWVIITCNFVMALGTMFGGWRIIKTMGMRITKLKPMHGSCAEIAGASTLFLATHLGVPVSTTHTITGAIFGVGASENASAVRWGLARRILVAWCITLPAAGIVAALFWLLAEGIHKLML